MSYLNPLLAYGYEDLARDAIAAGVCGFIVPDLPLEEGDEFREALETEGLALVQLVSPATPEDRMERLCAASRGFVSRPAEALSMRTCRLLTSHISCHAPHPRSMPWLARRLAALTPTACLRSSRSWLVSGLGLGIGLGLGLGARAAPSPRRRR